MAKEKPYVLELVNEYLIVYLAIGSSDYDEFVQVYVYDLIFKRVLVSGHFSGIENVVDILTGYLI